MAGYVAAWGRADVASITVHQLTPELAVAISEVEAVMFVEACADPAQCEVCLRRLESGPGICMGHTSDPHWLLALTEAVYGRRHEAWLVKVPATDFSLGEWLSPPARAGVDAALWQINRLVILRQLDQRPLVFQSSPSSVPEL